MIRLSLRQIMISFLWAGRNDKKRTVMSVSLLVVILCGIFLVPWAYLSAVPDMATGFVAKLGCSLRYNSGFDPQKVKRDIDQYSFVFERVKLEFDESKKTATSRFLFKEKTVAFEEGYGCFLYEPEFETQNLQPITGLEFPIDSERYQISSKNLEKLIEDHGKAGHDTRALLITHNGELLGEAYANGYDRNTVFLGWSMSKTFNAIVIGAMVKDRIVEVGEAALFPEWQDERRNISVRALLQMTPGLAFDEIYNPGTDATRMLFQDVDIKQIPLSSSQSHPVEKVWNYSSGSANLLSHLALERVQSPMKLRRYIYDEVLIPMGMNSAVLEYDSKGAFIGSSFMYATARDWAKIGQLFVNGGELHGTRIVTEEFVEQALQANTSDNEKRYGYQVWLNKGSDSDALRWPNLPGDAFAAKGNRGQWLIGIPSRKIVVVRLGWSGKAFTDIADAERLILELSSSVPELNFE